MANNNWNHVDCFFILIAFAAPMLAPNNPNATNLVMKNAEPSAEYPLGCDQMGRCELSRLLYGARYSLGLSIPVLIGLAVVALFVGSLSCYKGGMIDEMVRLVCDILMAFPLLVIAMALVSSFENSTACIIAAISISMTAWFLRMVRSYAKTECGAMLNEARNSLYSNPNLIIYPGICLLVCCAGFNLLGEGLRDSIGKEDDVSGI